MGGKGDSPEERPSDVYMEKWKGRQGVSHVTGGHAARWDVSWFRNAVNRCSDCRKWPCARREGYQL